MTRFYNPYQFIPLDTKGTETSVDYKQTGDLKAAENKFVRHDYWHSEGLSGRIRCQLVTHSPTVVGAKQISDVNNKDASVVTQYKDSQGNPAIPANSLRGMIASVAEAISQSAPRVLIPAEKGEYSVRKPAKNAKPHEKPLKKMGFLLQSGDNYQIYPLVDEQNFKSYSIGDYKKNFSKDNPERKRLREQEIKWIENNDCFRLNEDNREQEKFFSWRSHDKGILYIRGKFKGMPLKRRETFIPWDGVVEKKQKCLRVVDGCVETLDTMLKTLYSTQCRTPNDKKNHQLLPKGYNTEERQQCWEDDEQKVVWHGDIVYYREDKGAVVEISYSSIWRKAIEGSLHDSFKLSGGENAVSWDVARDSLTPAEAMFGVVEESPDNEVRGGARNLASRIRFSDAQSEMPITLQESVMLKVLNSPKPPSPAMYFSDAGGQYVPKADLNLSEHAPNGRKRYIPHKFVLDGSKAPWVTAGENERPNMKVRCEPIPKDALFEFTIHFENLSDAELGVLLTALQPNGHPTFLHRLGLGKPLGLGHVCIERYSVQTISRTRRYRVGALDQSRYETWKGVINTTLVDEKALAGLNMMSDPEQLEDIPVCYPFDEADEKIEKHQEPYNETDGFQWFSNNDRVGSKGRSDYLRREGSEADPMKPLKSD